jgi:predicted GNAT family acetyltransferase
MFMPYLLRDESGKVIKASSRTLIGGELVQHNHPDVVEFLKKRGQDPSQVEQALNELRRTDNEMARAVEDVIMVLLKKNIVKMTDWPKAVQDRMSFRVRQRVIIQDIYDQASARTTVE